MYSGDRRERLVEHTYETRWLRASGTRCTDRRVNGSFKVVHFRTRNGSRLLCSRIQFCSRHAVFTYRSAAAAGCSMTHSDSVPR
eukprot:1791570-Prymnesium_polylepis.1